MRARIALFLLGILLAATSAFADTRYYSVTLDGNKAGYTRIQTVSQGTGIKETSDCLIKLMVLGAPFDMRYQAISTYAKPGDRLPTRYTVNMSAGPQTVTSDCKFSGLKVEIDSIVNGARSHRNATLPKGCFLLEGNLPETWERLARTLGATSGTQNVQVFIPTQGGPIPLKVVWSKRNAFAVEIAGQSMTMEWNPAARSLVAMHEPIQKAVFKLADKDAMKDLVGYEAAARVFAVSNVMFENPDGLDSITLDLDALVGGARITAETLRIPTQTFTGSVVKNKAVGKLEIRKFSYDGKDSAPYPLPTEAKSKYSAYLKPGPMIESDDPDVKAQAKKLVAGTKYAWEATERISNWVHENIAYKITGATARICLKTKEGDCGPHTMLTIALLRAAGIPARVTGGALYTGLMGGSFGQHYWTRVWLGEKPGWIPIDTTSGEIGTLSPIHITLWDGLMGIGALNVKVIDFSPKSKPAAAAAAGSAIRMPLKLSADETWYFTYTQKGKKIGAETAKVVELKLGGGARISYRADFKVPQGSAVMSGEFTVAGNGAGESLTLKVEQSGITQTVTSKVEGGKVKATVETVGKKVDREVDLPADGYIGMATILTPWDIVIRTQLWKLDRTNETAVFLVDRLTMDRSKWKILKEEDVKVGGKSVPCIVVGASKVGEQFYVRKEDGKLIKAVLGGGELIVERTH